MTNQQSSNELKTKRKSKIPWKQEASILSDASSAIEATKVETYATLNAQAMFDRNLVFNIVVLQRLGPIEQNIE